MSSKVQNRNKLMRFITKPIRMLSRARELYVRSMTECAYGGPSAQFSALPKSYSVSLLRSNQKEDFSELIRAASTKSMGNRIDVDLIIRQQPRVKKPMTIRSNPMGLPKSCSVGMCRIDEDVASDFGKDGVGRVKPLLSRPRNRSLHVAL